MINKGHVGGGRWEAEDEICYRSMSVCMCSLFARVHKINQGKELSCRMEREINAKTQLREEAENDRRGRKRQVFPTAAIPSPCWNTGIRMGGGWKAGPQRDQCNLQSAFHTLSASGLSPGSCHKHTHTHTNTCAQLQTIHSPSILLPPHFSTGRFMASV